VLIKRRVVRLVRLVCLVTLVDDLVVTLLVVRRVLVVFRLCLRVVVLRRRVGLRRLLVLRLEVGFFLLPLPLLQSQKEHIISSILKTLLSQLMLSTCVELVAENFHYRYSVASINNHFLIFKIQSIRNEIQEHYFLIGCINFSNFLAKIETANQMTVFFYLSSDWLNFWKSQKIDH
jgi:hypothetical protein